MGAGLGRRIAGYLVVEHALVSRRALKVVASLTVLAVVAGGAIVRLTDQRHFHSLWDGMWWASSTVTTVGYGDFVPHSALGRLVAIALMFGGIGLVSILTAALASALMAEDVGAEELHIDVELAAIAVALERVDARLAEIEATVLDRAV